MFMMKHFMEDNGCQHKMDEEDVSCRDVEAIALLLPVDLVRAPDLLASTSCPSAGTSKQCLQQQQIGMSQHAVSTDMQAIYLIVNHIVYYCTMQFESSVNKLAGTTTSCFWYINLDALGVSRYVILMNL